MECGAFFASQRLFSLYAGDYFWTAIFAAADDPQLSLERERHISSYGSTGVVDDASLDAMASL
jgi:hypothetical protein